MKNAEKVNISEETMRFILIPEVEKITEMMVRQFEDIDMDAETKEHSGLISHEDMRKCLYSTVHLCVKEVNLLLRNYALKYGSEQINYTDF
jgi:hypothetical protein